MSWLRLHKLTQTAPYTLVRKKMLRQQAQLV